MDTWEATGYDMKKYVGHEVGAPNKDGITVLDFATAYQMRILNTSYQKRKNHLVTYIADLGNNESIRSTTGSRA